MLAEAVVEIRRRQRAIPWEKPIRVQFAGDDGPLYGCRVCILRFGLKRGDRSALFETESEAAEHIARHAE